MKQQNISYLIFVICYLSFCEWSTLCSIGHSSLCLVVNLSRVFILELHMVDVQTFFAGVLTDLRCAGKLFETPADSIARRRGWIWQHHRSVGQHTSLCQAKRANCRKLGVRSADVPDSESDDEHSPTVSANKSFHRQAIPPLISELTDRWQHCVNAVTSESAEDDELSAVDVVVLLLTVVKHVVYEDIKSAKEISTSIHLVPNIANILRDIICQLRLSSTDCQTVKAFSDAELVTVGRCVVRLFFLMLLQIGEQNNGLTWLRHCKSIEESVDCVSESLTTLSDDVKRRVLVIDYVVCCWMYAEGLLLRHHANTIVIATVCKTTELITRHGLDLTRSVLLTMSEGNSRQESSDSTDLVDLIKHVVAVCRLLKSMRSRYIHCCTCAHRTHRHCNIASQRSIYRHHHDALGIAVQSLRSDRLHVLDTNTSNDWLSSYCTLTNSCVISCLAIFLLGLFHNLVDTHVRVYLLDIFEKGIVTCCCLPVELLMATFISDQPSVSSQLRRRSVSVLVNILLTDCGGSAALDHCIVCDDVSVRNVANSPDSARPRGETSDSSSTCRWNCVSKFADMVCSVDSAFTVHVVSQAARLARSGSESLKQQLYCGFFMPLVVTVVHQLTAHRYNDSEMLTSALSVDIVPLALKLSLPALTTILASTAMLRQFLDAHGIEMLCKLACINTTRQSALSLLEVLVNVENSKSEREQTVKTVLALSDQSGDGVTSIGALDVFIQLLFSDWHDRQWNKHIRENLESSDCWVGQMLDLWHVACRLLPCNDMFRQRFVACSGPQLAYTLLVDSSEAFLALDCGPSTADIRVVVFYGQDEQSYVHERSLLLLIRTALSICLQCTNPDVGIPHQVNAFVTCVFHFAFDSLSFYSFLDDVITLCPKKMCQLWQAVVLTAMD